MPPVTPPGRTAPTQVRRAWIDAARGACVLAVVLFHVIAWHVAQLEVPAAAERVLDPVTSYLGSLRMPLLLAVSGLLASDRVLAGFRRGALVRRSVASYHLYVVWLLVYVAVYAVLDDPALPHAIDGPGAALRNLVVPQTPLWYVFAMAVLVPVLAAVRRVPAAVVLPLLAVVSLVVQVTDVSWGSAEKIPALAFYFAIGVFGKRVVLRGAEPLRPVPSLVAVVAAVLCVLAGPLVDGEVALAVLSLVRGTAFLAVGIVAVRLVCRVRAVGRPLEWVGRRTLPVYVVHVPLLLCLIAWAPRGPVSVAGTTVGAVAYPLVITVALVAASLGVHRLLVAVGAGAAFAAPQRLLRLFPGPDDGPRESRVLPGPAALLQPAANRPAGWPVPGGPDAS